MNLNLRASPEEVMRAVEALQAFGEERQVPSKILFGLTVALEECGSNIVNHALQHDSSQTFQVKFEHTGHELVIEMRDRGPEFDPTQAPVREPAADDEDRPPGGWGIQLVRRYTDAQQHTRVAGENILRLIKRLGPPVNQH